MCFFDWMRNLGENNGSFRVKFFSDAQKNAKHLRSCDFPNLIYNLHSNDLDSKAVGDFVAHLKRSIFYCKVIRDVVQAAICRIGKMTLFL